MGDKVSFSSGNSFESSRSSSTQSWIDDSEISFARELQEQYDKFEEALYSERSLSDLPKSLQAEVKIWSDHSPHMRICGTKATLHERPDDLEEEPYDINFEEIIDSHGSLEESLEKEISVNTDVRQAIEEFSSDEQEAIKTDLKNAIVDKLFDHALPRVLEKLEPVINSMSAGKKKPAINVIGKPEALETIKNQQNQRLTSRSERNQSNLKEIMKRKPPPVSFDNNPEYHQGFLSSRGLRRQQFFVDSYMTEKNKSAQLELPRSSLNRRTLLPSSVNNKSNRPVSSNTKAGKTKNGMYKQTDMVPTLPLIEAISIVPMAPDKRSGSAMVRFNKTLPRVGPDTQSKNISMSNMKTEGNGKETNKSGSLKSVKKQESSTDLQVVGTRSATSLRGNKWNY